MTMNIPLLSQTTPVLTPHQTPQELTEGQEKAAKSWGALTQPLSGRNASQPDRRDVASWAVVL